MDFNDSLFFMERYEKEGLSRSEAIEMLNMMKLDELCRILIVINDNLIRLREDGMIVGVEDC